MITFKEKQADILVGNRIKQRRKILNISQAELARQLGITFQQVQKYERGINGIRASRLIGIARILETTAGVLCGDNINLNKAAKQTHVLGLHISEMYKTLDCLVTEFEEVCTTIEGG